MMRIFERCRREVSSRACNALQRESECPAGIPDTEPGTVLKRNYQGQEVVVTVARDGFEYAGQTFRSLSGIAEKVTGTRWNGFVFFALQEARGE